MANMITGLFGTQAAAETAVQQLKQMGYGNNELTVIAKDRGTAADVAHEAGARTMEGVGEGAVIGGAIGAIVMGLLGVAGSVLLPGVGLIVAGSAAAAWAGAGMGAVAGGIIGWLVNIGVPKDIAPYYERGLNEGAIVVAVAAHPGDEARVAQALHGGALAYGGYNTPSYVAPAYQQRYTDITPPVASAR